MNPNTNDKVEISLIINDSTSTKIQLNISKVTNELINHLCEDLSSKFSLDERTKQKLYNHICKELSNIKIDKEKKEMIENQRYEYFNRLYYKDIHDKKEREDYYKKLNQENAQKELSNYSFTPSINLMSSRLYKRNYQRIEDRLYTDARMNGRRKKNKEVYKKGQLNDFTSQLDEKASKRPKTTWNNKVIRGTEENKEEDLDYPYNEMITNDRQYNNQQLPKGNNKTIVKDKKTGPLTNRNSFHKNTVQGNTLINNEMNTKAGFSKHIGDPKRKYTRSTKQIPIIEDISSSRDVILTTDINQVSTRRNMINYSESTDLINHSSQKEWVSRTIQSKSKLTNQKEKEMNRMYQSIYPFKPDISQNSKAMVLKKRKESKDLFIKRLSESKTSHSVRNAIKGLHSICNTEQTLNHNNSRSQCQSQRKNSQNSRRYLNKSERQIRTEPPIETAISSNPHSASFSERRIKTAEAKQEMEIMQSMKEIEDNDNMTKKQYKTQYIANLEKFKLNQLKEIYEILIRKGDELDFDSLIPCGIPQHIKDRVIVPTCYMINNKSLEFNFQNFYLIASEILSKFF